MDAPAVAGSAAPDAPGGASALPFWKVMVLGLSAMQIGPNLALAAGFQVPYSGVNSWLAYAGAALIAMLVAVVIVWFARRHSITATLLSFAQLSLPGWAVTIVAGTLLSAYILAPAISVLATTIYLASLASSFGFEVFGPVATSCIISAAVAVLIGACAYTGVELSAKISMVLGAVCIPLAVWITLKAGHSYHFDLASAPYAEGLSAVSLSRGTFIAMGFFIGFDCVAALAGCTSHPRRDAQRVLLWAVGIAALTLVLGALLQAPALVAHAAALEAGDSPAKILLEADGASSMVVLADLVLVATCIAGLIAWLGGAAVIVATAARDGFLPRWIGRLHARTGSPRCAILLLTAVSTLLPTAIFLATKATPLMATLYISNFLIFAWLVPYALLCVGLLCEPRGLEGAKAAKLAAGLGLILILVITVAQLAWPLNQTTEAINIASVVAIGFVSASYLVARRRQALRN